MKKSLKILPVFFLFICLLGCATSKDISRLEAKVDKLLLATNRTTLDEIFGAQSNDITKRIETLDMSQKEKFDDLKKSYEEGFVPLNEIREQMLTLLGGNIREVASERGIYIRNLQGEKIKAISNGTKINKCRILKDAEIPQTIHNTKFIEQYSWGIGEIEGTAIIFPWELSISSFTKEIVEHTAKKTAAEFIRMGGEKKWSRPINIQITTEKDEKIKISTNEADNEIYVNPPSTESLAK
ncbi:MAG: hypothetical protein HQK76_12805 [Desulfobacterales bacterium]|nr:hypothetical protein [Desulfobacterales bacterium]